MTASGAPAEPGTGVVVVGGSGAVGGFVAQWLRARGFRVATVDRGPVRALPPPAVFSVGDAEADWDAALAEASSLVGTAAAVVVASGAWAAGGLADASEPARTALWQANFTVPWLVARWLATQPPGQVLVLMGAESAHAGAPGQLAYNVAKRALDGLVDSLQAEWRGSGRRAHILHLGLLDTPGNAALADRPKVPLEAVATVVELLLGPAGASLQRTHWVLTPPA